VSAHCRTLAAALGVPPVLKARTDRYVLLALVFAVVCATSAGAQDSTIARRDGWIAGVSVGMPMAGGELAPELITVGFNATRFRPGSAGLDFSLGTMPRILAEGAIAYGIRANVSYPLVVNPSLALLPSAGLSMIGAESGDGGFGAMGVNAGISAVLFGPSSVGVRAGFSVHRLSFTDTPIFLLEVGVVRVPKLGR
jgi:hypothetical protein